MKPYLLTLFVVSMGLSSCMIHSSTPFAHDYRYEVKFNDYKTFALFTNLSAPNTSGVNTKLIESAIIKHMQMLGYTYNETSPDIMMAYSIHDHKMTFQGFAQANNHFVNKDEEGNIAYDPVNYKLRNGTLLIQILDFNTQECIWQGYSIDDYYSSKLDNDRLLGFSVSQILEQFRIFSMGHMDQKEQIARVK